MKYTTTPLRRTTSSVHGHHDDVGQSAPDSSNNMTNNNTPTASHGGAPSSSFSWGQMVTRTPHSSQQRDEVSWQVGEVQQTWDPSRNNSTITTTAMRFMPYPLRLLQEDEVLYQREEGVDGSRSPAGFIIPPRSNDTTNVPTQSILATIDSVLEIMRQYDDAEHDNHAEDDDILAFTVARSQQ
jgi:hypothetical protein